MIAIYDNGKAEEQGGIYFFEIDSHSTSAIQSALRLVDFDGEIIGTADAIRWTNGGATEHFVNHIVRNLEMDGSMVDFVKRLSQVPTEVLVVVAEALRNSKRLDNADEAFALEITREAAWRTRTSRRRRA